MTTLERDSKGRFANHDEGRHGGTSAVKLGLAAAAGAAVGVMAMFGRKTAVQAPTILAGDWPQALALEHKAVLKIFDAIAPEFLETIKAFRREIEEHVDDEENRQFPALFAGLSEEQNRKLTRAMNREGFKLA